MGYLDRIKAWEAAAQSRQQPVQNEINELHEISPVVVLAHACHCDPLPRWNEPMGAAGCNPDKHTRCSVCGYVWRCRQCGGCRRCRTPG